MPRIATVCVQRRCGEFLDKDASPRENPTPWRMWGIGWQTCQG
ncbi:MAG: hypothetical protein SGI77_16205 [Pirellulaceae bacterium]|nr:hypothetical protein [Pirellulaceae bacterium]